MAHLARQLNKINSNRNTNTFTTAVWLLGFALAATVFNYSLYAGGFFKPSAGDDVYLTGREDGQISLDLSGLPSEAAVYDELRGLFHPALVASNKKMNLIVPEVVGETDFSEGHFPSADGFSNASQAVTLAPGEGTTPFFADSTECAGNFSIPLTDEPGLRSSSIKAGVLAISAN
jgi:hypothetical protein